MFALTGEFSSYLDLLEDPFYPIFLESIKLNVKKGEELVTQLFHSFDR